MDELIKDLEVMDFSRAEAQVYLTLLRLGPQNGSKVAKHLGLVRSSVYHALDGLYQKGAVQLLPGTSLEYQAEEPEVLLGVLKTRYLQAADSVGKKLKELDKPPSEDATVNIRGRNNILDKARQMIREARTEVVLNLCESLEVFEPEIREAQSKGVRVIVFSFDEVEAGNLPVELYSHGMAQTPESEARLMVVADMESVLIGNSRGKNEPRAIVSRNRTLVSIAAEHIHHDIYFFKIRSRTGEDPVGREILLGTLLDDRTRWTSRD